MAPRERDDQLEQSTTRWIAVGIGLTAVFALMFPIYRWYEPAGRADARAELESSLAGQGADIYQGSCASCHGALGQGVDAPALNSRQFLEAADDEQIASLIAHGIPGTEMSAYSLDFGGFLTSEQIEALTTYLRSLEADAPDRPDWRFPDVSAAHDEGEEADDGHDEEPAVTAEPTDHDEEPTETEPTEHDEEPPTGDEPTGEEEDGAAADEPAAFDAEATYANSCARCHGADLSGVTDTGGDSGPAIGPTSHSLTEPDEHLVEAVTFGRDGMPAFLDELTVEEIDQIVGYIRQIQSAG